MKRRELLTAGASIIGSTFAPSKLFAATEAQQKCIFVFAQGGWDPTRVFAAEFSNPQVAMESNAGLSQVGNIQWVSHDTRPSVDDFFQQFYQDSLIINGLQIRSISHEICTTIAYTGGVSGSTSDWGTTIAAHSNQSLAIPHLVLGGPNFSGAYPAYVVQTGGNNSLSLLLDGSIQERSNISVPSLSEQTRSLIDQHIQARVHAKALNATHGMDHYLSQIYKESFDNALLLKNKRHVMDFATGTNLNSQIQTAVDSLCKGISRCCSIAFTGSNGLGWDTHADNDETQANLYQNLFSSLNHLMDQLHRTPDQDGTLLSDTTTVVVFSEMGRSPQLNATDGKDHWPFSSALIWSKACTGNRMIGSFSSNYQGMGIDLQSGEIDDSAAILGIESLGAALLASADIDPAEYILDADPLWGILR